MNKLTPRPVDHIVLPVPSLEMARQRYQQLGFTVAPDARHKFGTENACVNFRNGTFLEPLAIGHRETVEADAVKGNTFLRRDAAYRFRNGDNGFSCLVFASTDPKAERKYFEKAGYETGNLVTVRRPGVKVHLAFVLDDRCPDMSLFLCERPDGPPQFPKKLSTHDNGALGIARVVMHEPVPSDFQYYLQQVSGERDPRSHSFGLDFKLPNATVSVLNSDGLLGFYGIRETFPGRGLRLIGFDIQVKSLAKVTELLNDRSVASRKVGSRIVIDPAPGQGAYLSFVEK